MIKLIAGDVKRVQPTLLFEPRYDNDMVEYSSEPNFEEQELFDYHLYSLREKTTLKNNQSKTRSISFSSITSL